jgi:ABC-type Fe3+-siderophore transport system permease subunit
MPKPTLFTRVLLSFFVIVVMLITCLVAMPWQPNIQPAIQWHLITQLQIPLILTASLSGASLAVSGACLQVVLRNPLADPGVIGITSGASLCAAFLMIFAPTTLMAYLQYWLPLGCFVGALISTWLIYRISRYLQGMAAAVILAGITISTLAGAIIGWLYLLADAQSMRNLTFWLMGSLYQTDYWILAVAGPIILASVSFMLVKAKQLNQLYAGELIAASTGVNVQKLNKQILLASALAVGASVSIAGSIAFIGLLVPHFLRLKLGYNNQHLLPLCALTGAIILLCVALITEATQVVSLPVSMVTATLGGPLLLWALYRGHLR